MQDNAKLKEILETQDLGGIDKVVKLASENNTEEIPDLLTRYICEKFNASDDMDDFKANMNYTIQQLKNIQKVL